MTQKQLSLGKVWDVFEREQLQGAPADQVVEMKKAYYFGASSLMLMMKQIDESLSDEQGVVLLESLEAECIQFLMTLANSPKPRQGGKGFSKEAENN